jgi:CRISPR/Cas system-associated exonuclease Cas4 (RecB family)
MSDLKNEFSWSASRNRIFSECHRAYYYRHYGSWGGWDPEGDPAAREAYILKNLGNRYTFAGRVVHETVADVLNRHRYGREVGPEEAKRTALDALRKGFQESRSGAYRLRPKRALGLFEHEYAEDVSDEAWQRMRDRVFTCLENFYRSKIREVILETRIENWLPIDTLDSFDFEGTKVYVAPDFALRNDQGNALLIDWKTGRPGEDHDRMQLVCYGLFAREKWGVDPRRSIGELHYLLTGDVEIVTLDEAALAEGTEHMRESIRGMKVLLTDPEKNVADIERFAQTDDRAICARCNFRRLCWPEWPATGD